MTLVRRLTLAAGAASALVLLSIPAADYYYRSTAGEGCAACHEIRINLDKWQHSAHRKVSCQECHTSSTATNVRRVVRHLAGTVPEQIHLGLEDVLRMSGRCQSCHQEEFAQWQSGRHSATYASIFTDAQHNRKRLLMDDCLRCHGMYFQGGIRDLVQPVSTTGPWRLRFAELAKAPAIPCLTCHSMHDEGEPLSKPEVRIGAREEISRPSISLMDRRSQLHLKLTYLPIPAVMDGVRPVKMSPDRRQALCYQCHAPEAARQVATGDDRTPVGVHEGLSCLACHRKHGMETRASCAECHPRLSNCGLDAEKMDTTFRDPKSGHNIHFFKCADCHSKGVPKTRRRAALTKRRLIRRQNCL